MAAGTIKVLDPQTGKVTEVPSGPEAQQQWLAGKHQLVDGGSVPMIGPDGRTVMDAPAGKVQGAIDAGWNFADPKQVLSHDAEGQKLQAFVEGAGSQLTLGLSDAVMRGAGSEGLAERRKTAAGVAGEAAGLGAGFFIPGLGEAGAAEAVAGKSLARTALDAALTPLAAVTHVGNAIEKTAGDALAKTIENQAVARIAGSVIGRGVEGAAYGAGGALSEESLGNPDMNAQSLLAAIGGGSLMGGVVGGALGGGFRTFGEGVSSVTGRLKSKPMLANVQEISDGLGATGIDVSPDNPLLQKFKDLLREDLPASIGGYAREDIRAVNTPKAQAWLKEGKNVLEESGRDFRGVVDAMRQEQIEAGEKAYQQLKPAALAEHIPTGSTNLTLGKVADNVDEIRGHLLSIVENEAAHGLGEGGGLRIVKPYLDALDNYETGLFKKAGVARQYEERMVVEHPIYNAENRQAAAAQQAQDRGVHVPEAELPAPARDRVLKAAQEVAPGPKWDTEVQELAGVSREELDQILTQAKTEGWNPRYSPSSDLQSAQTREGKFFPADTVDSGALPPVRSRTEVTQRTRSLRDLATSYTVPEGVVHEAFTKLDRLKGLLAKPGKFGDELADAGAREIQDSFQKAYGAARAGLEDSTVWGQAGVIQKELNDAYSQRASAWRDLKKAIRFQGDEIDPAAIQGYISKIDKLKGDRVTELLDQWQGANRKFAEVADAHFGGGSGILDRAKKLDGEFTRVRTNLGEKVGVFNALQRLTERRNQVFSFSGGGVVNSIIGGALGNVLGAPAALAGLATQSIIDPGRTALLRANTAGTVRKVGDYITAKTEQLVTGLKKTLPPPGSSERLVSRATIRMLEAKTPEARQEAYRERLAEIQTLQDPWQFGENSGRQLGELSDAMPAHAQALQNTATIALGVLGASLPPIRAGSVGDGPFDGLHKQPQAHDRDILKFAQVDHVLQNPLSVLDRVESGYLFQHEVEALNKAYPGLADRIRAAVVASAAKGKGRVPHARSRALGQLLGAPAASYQKISQYQAIHAAPMNVQPPNKPSGSTKTSARTTGLQSTTDRLDTFPFPS